VRDLERALGSTALGLDSPLAAQLLREQQLARWHTASRLVFLVPESGIWNKGNFTARV
jgi:hypothetical protein